ncbi:hypothetical protein ACFYS7_35230 [Streptomyces avermitilis]|uniref:hypothetical protein n=1 Tax=Streptomyces avermitilis TaxID=33903 RepID=UPI0033C86E48
MERYIKDQIRQPAPASPNARKPPYGPVAASHPRNAPAAKPPPPAGHRYPALLGLTAAPDTTDDVRIRHFTLALPVFSTHRTPEPANGNCATSQPRRSGEVSFGDGGRRAHGLAVELTDIEHLEFDL